MQKISKLVAAVALCVAGAGLAGCSGPELQPTPGFDQQWFENVFDDGHDTAEFPGGGGSIGATITVDEFAAGWYAVDLACKGAKDATFTISRKGSTLGEGTTGCGGDGGGFNTTMDLPAGPISTTAASKDPSTAWAVRFRPTTAPTP